MNARPVVLTCLVALASALLPAGCGGSKPRVVLYCAQDKEFAERVLPDFTAKNGPEVAPKYDTEAGKSVVLYQELLYEKDRPRCDVFWNNEVLSTIRLERQGLLEPYASPSARPYPASARAEDHSWHAFAKRARVLLVNTQRVPKEEDWPKGLLDLTGPRWKGRVAMSKPEHGTSATQAACLFEVLGPEQARAYYRALRDNDVQVVSGNKQVAEGVARGQFDVGVTDTDDAIIEVKAGRPVAIVFPDREGNEDHPRLGTLFIPNTLAIIKGGPNPEGARKLVDYLLSAEVEAELARSDSHQVPMNPEVKAELPPALAAGVNARAMRVDYYKAADLWAETQTFVRNEFLRP